MIKNKRGVSVVIGYVLLITTAIAMSVIVYQWIKSYVPQDSVECPSDLSISVTSFEYEKGLWLNLTLKNNGHFNIGGIFVRGSNRTQTQQEIATINLESYALYETVGQGSIIFSSSGENTFKPGNEKEIFLYLAKDTESISPYSGEIYFIDIIPTRWTEIDGKTEFTSCGNSRITKEIVSL